MSWIVIINTVNTVALNGDAISYACTITLAIIESLSQLASRW